MPPIFNLQHRFSAVSIALVLASIACSGVKQMPYVIDWWRAACQEKTLY